jgi:hypothetical protein
MSGNTLVAQRGVRSRAGVIGIETRLRLFGPKSRGCGVDAALVPHHGGASPGGRQVVASGHS